MTETVSNYLFGPCSFGLLTELSEQSEYWAKVRTFVEENENRTVKFLSAKQRIWLEKIRIGLLEEASK